MEIIKKEKIGKEITGERQALLSKLEALEEEKSQLDNELKKIKDFSSTDYEHMKKNIVVCKPIVHYFMLIRHCIQHLTCSQLVLNRWPRKEETAGRITYFQ